MFRYILTLGPASSEESIIRRLLKTADAFRLNSSHLSAKELKSWLSILSDIFTKDNKTIPVIIDLQGSKMRIGAFNYIQMLPDIVQLQLLPSSGKENIIPVPHKEFFDTVKVNDIVTLNDVKVKIRIKEIASENILAEVIQNGPLSSNKGINIENHPVTLTKLSDKDSSIIETAIKYEFTQFAYSFVLTGNEESFLKQKTENRRIIAKIERKEAFDYLNNISRKFDEIWLCRGDLGAQAGLLNLGELQEYFVSQIQTIKKHCILAGQVLEHMTFHNTPTRSEVVHLYDTKINGFKGIILSDETAVGKNPAAVADFLDFIRKI